MLKLVQHDSAYMIFSVHTKGHTDIIDITNEVSQAVQKENIKEGIANIFVKGSTAAVTTIEADENLFDDLRDALEKIFPIKHDWKHHRTWGDDNGGSHLRATVFGPSVTIPIMNNQLILGTWQKIVLIDFDTNSRDREVVVTCLGR